jgi:hypothetical protein
MHEYGLFTLRQVYKETARFPFIEVMQREMRTHSAPQLLFAGMPSFFTAWSLQWSSTSSAIIRDSVW